MYHKLGNLPYIGLESAGISQLKVQYGIEKDGEFLGLKYYYLKPETEQLILQKLVPQEYRHLFEVSLMVINTNYVSPHTDSGISIVINYYIETGDATTIFWKQKHENARTFKIKNQTDGSIYDEKDLKAVGYFKANKNDVWLLDVDQIHSVIGYDNLRVAYCLQSDKMKYKDAVRIFNTLPN